MKSLDTDPWLYVKTSTNGVEGLLGSYIDDCLLSGDEKFQELFERTPLKLDCRPKERDEVEFLGTIIRTSPINQGEEKVRTFSVGQPDHLAKACKIPSNVDFDKFRFVHASFGCLAHSRPDVGCAIDVAAQITEETFSKRHVDGLNRAIHRVSTLLDLFLTYGPLDHGALHLRAYTGAPFVTNNDHPSQLGYELLLWDDRDRYHVLNFSSLKCKRVVRSITAREIYAFAEEFDNVFAIRHALEKLYSRSISTTTLTDSKQMFDVIIKVSHTAEKRLMIDIAASREAYNKHAISNVGLVLSELNSADGLTKVKACRASEEVVRIGYDCYPVQQWIFRQVE